ncbi:MAG: SCP2 sterol-binding domain-containing protein [Candidatus Hodarchaeota archaeon]
MNYYDLITSHMVLDVLLYTISELSKYNEKVKSRIKDHQFNILFSVEEGPIEYLEIKNNGIFFERRKKIPNCNAKIHFKDPNTFFKILKREKLNFEQLKSEGKIEIIEESKCKNICVDLLNFALPYSNYNYGQILSPEDEYILSKTLLYGHLIGFQEIAEADENVQIEMKGVNVIIQFNVIDGPKCYFHFNDGSFSGLMDIQHPNPTVNITMSDNKSAIALFSGNGDATRMYIKGDIQIEGDYTDAMKLMSLRELVSEYQDYVRAKSRK